MYKNTICGFKLEINDKLIIQYYHSNIIYQYNIILTYRIFLVYLCDSIKETKLI